MKLALDHPLISYSDYYDIQIAPDRVAFLRPQWDQAGLSFLQPAARVRITTDAARITLRGINTAKITRDDIYCPFGGVLINGRFSKQFSVGPRTDAPATFTVEVLRDTADMGLIEFVMPHGASLEVTALELDSTAQVCASQPRPESLYVAYGDSITQGYAASCSADTWAFKLAQMCNWRLINLGYGGKRASAADGTIIGQLKPTIVTCLIGYNDYVHQTDLGQFMANVRATLEDILRLSPSTRVFVITPLWALRDNRYPLHLEMYRQAIRTAVTNMHADNIHVIDGESLTGPEPNLLPDGTHPGDLGCSQIFMALLPHLSNAAA